MCFRRGGAGNRKYQVEPVELLQHTCFLSAIICYWLYKDRLELQMMPDCLTTFVVNQVNFKSLCIKVFVASYLIPSVTVYSPLRPSFLEHC